MDILDALPIFDTLSQKTRLRTFRLLVQAGPKGMPAGALSESLAIPHNTLSFHLRHLSQAGIVSSTKQGRSVIYAANFDTMHQLIAFLVKDCCSQDFAQIREGQESGQTNIVFMNSCSSTPTKPEV